MPATEARFEGLLDWQVEVLKTLDDSRFLSEVGNAWIRRYGARRIPITPEMIAIDPAVGLAEDQYLLVGGAAYLPGPGPSISVPGYPGTWPGSVWANEQIRRRVADEVLVALAHSHRWYRTPKGER